MADKPVAEIVNLDEVLDALPDSPTSSDVYEATLPFPARDVAASAAQRALNGGGGGTPDLAAVLAEGAAAGGAAITGLADPSGDQDAATKKYVDDNSGSASLVETVVDEILFSDFAASEAEFPSWPGVAPYRTIAATQIVFACWIIVMEAFNDSGNPNEIQVTDDPEGDSVQLSNAPNPTVLGANDATVWKYAGGAVGASLATAGCIAPYRPKASITPIAGLSGFAGDGTTGRALIFTTLYTPPA